MFLDKHYSSIKELCKKYEVKSLFVFGSVITDKFVFDSVVDFVVDLNSKDPLEYAENYFNLKFALEDLLKRQIDLLENKAIKNLSLKESINQIKNLVYAA